MNTVPSAFDRIVRTDPLFAAEGADIEASRHALMRIERAAGVLERAFMGPSRRSWRYWAYGAFFTLFPLHRYAIPFEFLRSFLESEEMRRKYLQEPTRATAKVLVAAWKRSAQLYSADLARYVYMHRIILRLETRNGSYRLQDLSGNVTTESHVHVLLAAMNENANALKKDVETCERLLAGEHIEVPAVLPVEPRVTAGVLSPQLARLHEIEIEGSAGPFRMRDIVERHGPFALTLDTFDKEPTEHLFMYYELLNRETGLRPMAVIVLDRHYFTKVWDAASAPKSQLQYFYGGLSPQDTPYWYEAAGYLYSTRDPSYWLDIATHVDAARRTDVDAQLVLRQKSSMLEGLFAACLDDLRTYTILTQRRVRVGKLGTYSLMYALLMRTHPKIYYLCFNQSVWRLPDSPRFAGAHWEPGLADDYESEEQVLAQLSEADLMKVMGAQKLRHERDKHLDWLDV